MHGADVAGVAAPGGGQAELHTLAFTAAGPDGPHTVVVEADPRLRGSLGPLAPLYASLDQEALGDWVGE